MTGCFSDLSAAFGFKCIYFFSENNHLAVGTDDGEIYIWETETFALKKKFIGHKATITAINYGPDGQTLASCGMDKLFQILDVNTGLSVFNKIFSCCLTSLKWSQSIIVLGDESGVISVWDIVEVKFLFEVKAHDGLFWYCCF